MASLTHNASRDQKKLYATSHTGELKSEFVALKALLKAYSLIYTSALHLHRAYAIAYTRGLCRTCYLAVGFLCLCSSFFLFLHVLQQQQRD